MHRKRKTDTKRAKTKTTAALSPAGVRHSQKTPPRKRNIRLVNNEKLHKIAENVRTLIAQRKSAENDAREDARQLHTLIANVSDGITLSDHAGHFEIFNTRMQEITGYTIAEANRCGDFSALIYPDPSDRDEAIGRLTEVFSNGMPEEVETTIRSKNGSLKRLRILTILVPYKGHSMFLTVYRDITELKNTQSELLASLQKFQQSERNLLAEIAEHKIAQEALTIFLLAVEETADMVIITDRDGMIEYVNPAFTKITGYAKSDAVGQTPRILKSGKHDHQFYRALWSTILSGQTFRDTLTNRTKNGTLYYAEKTVTPIKNERGEIIRFVSIDRDVTYQKEMEKARRLLQLGELVSDMAHEVNNPLMIISGNAQLALMEKPQSQSIIENLKIIVKECTRARDIIQRLLTFSRPSKGELKKTSINKTVEGAVALVEHQFKLMNITVHRSYADDIPLISLDENQIHEVLVNLLNNARDAMLKGGVISITTSMQSGSLRLDLVDTGSGMTDAVMKRLFEPFFTTKEKGTGLGLSVCYGIIKAHGGELRFASEPGKGTTATILLPVAQEKHA